MLNSPYFWWIVLALWVALDIYSLIKNYKARGLSYAVKCEINSLKCGVVLIWAVIFFVGAILPAPSIIKLVEQYQAPEQFIKVIASLVPTAYLILVMFIYYWVVFNASNPLIKYNDEEKQWQREGVEKFRGKLPKQLKWLIKVEPQKEK